ncbi:Uncharacterised protein [uncultured archaeon]|nr:Uncharacterised protein [uncultured archaeon]
MVCYIIPAIGAVLVHAQRKIHKRNDEPGMWLTLLLSGGSLFGAVDHLWNGELFFIGKNPANDLLLGLAITAAIYAFWYAMMAASFASKAAKPQSAAAQ